MTVHQHNLLALVLEVLSSYTQIIAQVPETDIIPDQQKCICSLTSTPHLHSAIFSCRQSSTFSSEEHVKQ